MKKIKIFLIVLFIINFTSGYTDTFGISYLINNSIKAFEENRVEDGLILLIEATDIAQTQKDVKACLEVGSVYARLPEELEMEWMAVSTLKKGAEFAIEQGNWPVLGKFAKALEELGEKDAAIEIYDEIYLKAAELRDKDTFRTLKVIYERLGDLERAELCRQMIEKLTILPPKGWQPCGETVRGPKTVSVESGQVHRRIADQQIQQSAEYFIEKQKLEAEKRRRRYPF